MSMDSFKVYTIRQVIGTVQGTLTPWFRFISSEGLATLLACALGTLIPRAPLVTITPRGFSSGPYIYEYGERVYWVKYKYIIK